VISTLKHFERTDKPNCMLF